jgi:mRNA-degrading endonuclease toxin of MazEF toxin-antitoxin module
MQTRRLLLFALILASLAACSHSAPSPDLPLSREPASATIVTSQPGTGTSAEDNLAELRKRPDQLLAGARIGFVLSGDAADDSRPVLIEVARSAGFQVATEPKEANLLLRGEVRVEKIENPSSPWQWLLATLSGELVDTRTGSSLGTINENCREGAPNPARARANVLQTLAEQTAAGIRRALIRAVTGDNDGKPATATKPFADPFTAD